MDMVGLYPNLSIQRSAVECGKEMEETEIDYDNVDDRWEGRFIASNMSQDEIDRDGLSRMVPRRKKKCGTRPGCTTKELHQKKEYLETGEEIEKDSKWREVGRELTKGEKKRVLGKVVELGVKILVRNHVYQFEGKNRVQREGEV